jgi:ketosteroid isomerase-like protein
VSEGNVELHRRSVSAFNSRDADAYVALADPQIELHSVFAAVGGASYRGRDGVRAWFQDLEDVWGPEVRFQVDEYFDLGERTLAIGSLHGRGQQSGAEVTLTGFQAITWRDGQAVYYRAYTDKDACMEDLGISEDELEPIAP